MTWLKWAEQAQKLCESWLICLTGQVKLIENKLS